MNRLRQKALASSLAMHLLLAGTTFWFIREPYEVETVTIPLSLPIAFYASGNDTPEVETSEPSAAAMKEEPDVTEKTPPVKMDQNNHPHEKVQKAAPPPVVMTNKVTDSKVLHAESTVTQYEEPKLEAVEMPLLPAAVSPKVIANEDQNPAPKAEVPVAAAAHHRAPAAPPSAAQTGGPPRQTNTTIKANFDIIRKKTLERLYYPRSAQRARQGGTVTLIYKLSANGRVESVILERGTGFKELDAIALKAARSLEGERLQSVAKRINIRLSVEFAVASEET